MDRIRNLRNLWTSSRSQSDKMGANGAPTVISTRLAASGPAGLGALLLIGSLALGHTAGSLAPLQLADQAGAIRLDEKRMPEKGDTRNLEATAKSKAEAAMAAAADADATTASHQGDGEGGAGQDGEGELAQYVPAEKPEATPKPAPVETPKPVVEQPKPEAQPTAKPVQQPAPPAAPAPPTTLALSVSPHEVPGKLVLSWTAYTGDLFQYYKLVRTTDGDPTWPAGGADEVIGAFGNAGETWTKDRPACGTTVFYRVFAVRKVDGAYQVLAPSNVVSAATACPPPPPATQGIGLEGAFAEGQVTLAWGSCAVEHFNAYKVVRSMTNPDPTYPENGGTELVAAIGDPGQTWFADPSVQSGQTWFYRVVARAEWEGGHYIACQSPVLAVTVP